MLRGPGRASEVMEVDGLQQTAVRDTATEGSRKCHLCSARWLPTDLMIEGKRLFRFPLFTKMSRDLTAE